MLARNAAAKALKAPLQYKYEQEEDHRQADGKIVKKIVPRASTRVLYIKCLQQEVEDLFADAVESCNRALQAHKRALAEAKSEPKSPQGPKRRTVRVECSIQGELQLMWRDTAGDSHGEFRTVHPRTHLLGKRDQLPPCALSTVVQTG